MNMIDNLSITACDVTFAVVNRLIWLYVKIVDRPLYYEEQEIYQDVRRIRDNSIELMDEWVPDDDEKLGKLIYASKVRCAAQTYLDHADAYNAKSMTLEL